MSEPSKTEPTAEPSATKTEPSADAAKAAPEKSQGVTHVVHEVERGIGKVVDGVLSTNASVISTPVFAQLCTHKPRAPQPCVLAHVCVCRSFIHSRTHRRGKMDASTK
jgi:hypothetical protein